MKFILNRKSEFIIYQFIINDTILLLTEKKKKNHGHSPGPGFF
jgi:hypothetical protein